MAVDAGAPPGETGARPADAHTRPASHGRPTAADVAATAGAAHAAAEAHKTADATDHAVADAKVEAAERKAEKAEHKAEVAEAKAEAVDPKAAADAEVAQARAAYEKASKEAEETQRDFAGVDDAVLPANWAATKAAERLRAAEAKAAALAAHDTPNPSGMNVKQEIANMQDRIEQRRSDSHHADTSEDGASTITAADHERLNNSINETVNALPQINEKPFHIPEGIAAFADKYPDGGIFKAYANQVRQELAHNQNPLGSERVRLKQFIPEEAVRLAATAHSVEPRAAERELVDTLADSIIDNDILRKNGVVTGAGDFDALRPLAKMLKKEDFKMLFDRLRGNIREGKYDSLDKKVLDKWNQFVLGGDHAKAYDAANIGENEIAEGPQVDFKDIVKRLPETLGSFAKNAPQMIWAATRNIANPGNLGRAFKTWVKNYDVREWKGRSLAWKFGAITGAIESAYVAWMAPLPGMGSVKAATNFAVLGGGHFGLEALRGKKELKIAREYKGHGGEKAGVTHNREMFEKRIYEVRSRYGKAHGFLTEFGRGMSLGSGVVALDAGIAHGLGTTSLFEMGSGKVGGVVKDNAFIPTKFDSVEHTTPAGEALQRARVELENISTEVDRATADVRQAAADMGNRVQETTDAAVQRVRYAARPLLPNEPQRPPLVPSNREDLLDAHQHRLDVEATQPQPTRPNATEFSARPSDTLQPYRPSRQIAYYDELKGPVDINGNPVSQFGDTGDMQQLGLHSVDTHTTTVLADTAAQKGITEIPKDRLPTTEGIVNAIHAQADTNKNFTDSVAASLAKDGYPADVSTPIGQAYTAEANLAMQKAVNDSLEELKAVRSDQYEKLLKIPKSEWPQAFADMRAGIPSKYTLPFAKTNAFGIPVGADDAELKKLVPSVQDKFAKYFETDVHDAEFQAKIAALRTPGGTVAAAAPAPEPVPAVVAPAAPEPPPAPAVVAPKPLEPVVPAAAVREPVIPPPAPHIELPGATAAPVPVEAVVATGLTPEQRIAGLINKAGETVVKQPEVTNFLDTTIDAQLKAAGIDLTAVDATATAKVGADALRAQFQASAGEQFNQSLNDSLNQLQTDSPALYQELIGLTQNKPEELARVFQMAITDPTSAEAVKYGPFVQNVESHFNRLYQDAVADPTLQANAHDSADQILNKADKILRRLEHGRPALRVVEQQQLQTAIDSVMNTATAAGPEVAKLSPIAQRISQELGGSAEFQTFMEGKIEDYRALLENTVNGFLTSEGLAPVNLSPAGLRQVVETLRADLAAHGASADVDGALAKLQNEDPAVIEKISQLTARELQQKIQAAVADPTRPNEFTPLIVDINDAIAKIQADPAAMNEIYAQAHKQIGWLRNLNHGVTVDQSGIHINPPTTGAVTSETPAQLIPADYGDRLDAHAAAEAARQVAPANPVEPASTVTTEASLAGAGERYYTEPEFGMQGVTLSRLARATERISQQPDVQTFLNTSLGDQAAAARHVLEQSGFAAPQITPEMVTNAEAALRTVAGRTFVKSIDHALHDPVLAANVSGFSNMTPEQLAPIVARGISDPNFLQTPEGAPYTALVNAVNKEYANIYRSAVEDTHLRGAAADWIEQGVNSAEAAVNTYIREGQPLSADPTVDAFLNTSIKDQLATVTLPPGTATTAEQILRNVAGKSFTKTLENALHDPVVVANAQGFSTMTPAQLAPIVARGISDPNFLQTPEGAPYVGLVTSVKGHYDELLRAAIESDKLQRNLANLAPIARVAQAVATDPDLSAEAADALRRPLGLDIDNYGGLLANVLQQQGLAVPDLTPAGIHQGLSDLQAATVGYNDPAINSAVADLQTALSDEQITKLRSLPLQQVLTEIQESLADPTKANDVSILINDIKRLDDALYTNPDARDWLADKADERLEWIRNLSRMIRPHENAAAAPGAVTAPIEAAPVEVAPVVPTEPTVPEAPVESTVPTAPIVPAEPPAPAEPPLENVVPFPVPVGASPEGIQRAIEELKDQMDEVDIKPGDTVGHILLAEGELEWGKAGAPAFIASFVANHDLLEQMWERAGTPEMYRIPVTEVPTLVAQIESDDPTVSNAALERLYESMHLIPTPGKFKVLKPEALERIVTEYNRIKEAAGGLAPAPEQPVELPQAA